MLDACRLCPDRGEADNLFVFGRLCEDARWFKDSKLGQDLGLGRRYEYWQWNGEPAVSSGGEFDEPLRSIIERPGGTQWEDVCGINLLTSNREDASVYSLVAGPRTQIGQGLIAEP